MATGFVTRACRRRRRMACALVGVVALVTPVALAPAASAAVGDVGDVGIFELDSNPDPVGSAPPVDWEDLFTSTGTDATVSLGTAGTLMERTFVADPVADDNSYFASNGGGVKDIAPIGTWGCKTQHTPTPKDNLFNAYAMLAQVGPDHATRAGHLILYLGAERKQNEGSAFAGFWVNQDLLTCNLAEGEFDGSRTNGDLLVVADYESGGDVEQLAAYKWVGGNTTTTSAGNLAILEIATGVTNADCDSVGTGADLCATTNSGNVATAWGPPGVREPGTFVEAGLDLTALYGGNQNVPCFSQMFAETRSSRELTATLKDFAEDSFDTCQPPGVTTNLFEELGAIDRSLAPTAAGPSSYTVTLPAQVYDTVTLSGTSGTVSGDVTYSLWRDSACTTASTDPLFTGGTNSHTVTIANGVVPPSPTLVFDDPGTWYWKANYLGAGRNLPGESVCSSEPLIVGPRQPAIATTPSVTTIAVGNGNSFSDTANISGGYFPSGGAAPGTVTFDLYGPFATAAAIVCTGTPVFTSASVAAARLTDTTARAVSAAFTPTAVGFYQWVASYSGNAQNLSVTGLCSDTAERVEVTPATPGIATKILLADSVKMSGVPGAGTPTGTVTFSLFGPFADVASISCTGTALNTQGPVTLSAAGTATTPNPVAVLAGVYAWGVTFDSTSDNYLDTASACTAEVASVGYQAPSPFS
ncbi:MAG TPA: hypothetical protein VNA12_04735 [Mycobacteriales bacterium]|nr:hypothetical protein [Mycobacteriales bacterium]